MSSEELQSIKCPACGGALGKSYRIERDDDDEERVPVAKCQACGKVYDQFTSEYYSVFADDLTGDKDDSVFYLGAKGVLNGVEYEVIGRIRYQEEDEYDKETWDEWFAVSSDGVYHYFVEENGKVYSYEDYVPNSIDLDSDFSYIEFDGKKISKEHGYVGRIVYSEGELPWEPEIGEPVKCYDIKNNGAHFSVEQSDSEVSINKGEIIPYGEIFAAFSTEEQKKLYDNTMKKRKTFRMKSRIYMAVSMLLLLFSMYSCVWTKSVAPSLKRQVTISEHISIPENRNNYFNQSLWGPFEIKKESALYEIKVKVNERVQPFSNQWQSYRLMLIHGKKLDMFLKKTDKAKIPLKNAFDAIDTLEEPLEYYTISGDFWDETGYDSDGRWHESDLKASADIVIEDAGQYYAYLETLNNKMRDVNSIRISVKQVKGFKYYFIFSIFMFVLYLICRGKAKSYNELPFRIG